MNLFGKEPQEQAISTLIHDTNGPIGTMKYWTKKTDEWVKETHKRLIDNGIKMESNPYIYIEYLKSDLKRLQDALDVYYERAKKDFKE